ncbi:MAG: DUF6644 family protein [Phenylobacterium sp.]|uniref:DUF6644 family protein n=1 Tax=Phenylobacterium sp. TaxID=1871053 RepID=UPI00391A2863
MELADWIGAWPGARLVQRSAVAYLFVNAAHILGVGLILGAILPLDLRLLGVLRSPPLQALGPFLSRTAAAGVLLAVFTGAWLFSVRPHEYFENAAWRWKMAMLFLAVLNVAVQHRGRAYREALGGAPPAGSVRLLAAASALLWLAVLVAGRWIGFL